MASNYRSMFLSGFTISTTGTGLVDEDGNALATANIVGSGNYAYSSTMTLNGDTDNEKANDIIKSSCPPATASSFLPFFLKLKSSCNNILSLG